MVGVYQSTYHAVEQHSLEEMLQSEQDIKLVGGTVFNVYSGEESLHILPEDKENKEIFLRKDCFHDATTQHATAIEYIAVELADQKENLESNCNSTKHIGGTFFVNFAINSCFSSSARVFVSDIPVSKLWLNTRGPRDVESAVQETMRVQPLTKAEDRKNISFQGIYNGK
ncbi:hypothetical protein SELMODRAFT_417923 [Selaginella moellendorffii]|uniref:Uncharacterized protein n=1 Tax=Selaginella moellendorffii TaxID=88036 RepID=D8S439_SELML|nr:hypothetical protein SELMODRAFT_417923 [Selaginella moellendorffii]